MHCNQDLSTFSMTVPCPSHKNICHKISNASSHANVRVTTIALCTFGQLSIKHVQLNQKPGSKCDTVNDIRYLCLTLASCRQNNKSSRHEKLRIILTLSGEAIVFIIFASIRNKGQLLNVRICSCKSKFFPLRVCPNLEEPHFVFFMRKSTSQSCVTFVKMVEN